ncbi:hypothetical protein [Kitasatospora sp. NPDC059462]|uniref:hypothetical protein n=1 Tax=Kitasatospora sp. NPDC059462 TaxID=3346841 RepID=UPI0036CDB801
MTLHALLQFLTEAAADPTGPQARQLASLAFHAYRLARAGVGAVRFLRDLRRRSGARADSRE